MARIVFRQYDDGNLPELMDAGTELQRLLLADIDKVQQLREHTVHPPGQERYVQPVDAEALQELLVELGDDATDAATLLAETVHHDDAADVDVSLTTIENETDFTTGDAELEELQGFLSDHMVETGNFLLSFDRGVIAAAIEQDWIVVLEDDGETLFTL